MELLGFSSDGAQPCLVYEYMPNGSLLDRLACLVSKMFSSSQLPYFVKVGLFLKYLWNSSKLSWPNSILLLAPVF